MYNIKTSWKNNVVGVESMEQKLIETIDILCLLTSKPIEK